MNIPYVVFDLTTGAPQRWGQCQPETLAAQAGEGQRALATADLTVDGNRAIIWAEVKAQRDLHINGGAPTPAGIVDSDNEARANVSGAALAAVIAKAASAAYAVTWTLLDNSPVTLNADGMIAMGLAVMAHVDACHGHARDLRGQIEAASDMAELLAIDVTVGWPQ